MNKYKTTTKSMLFIVLFLTPIYTMDKEWEDHSKQLSVGSGWEFVEDDEDAPEPVFENSKEDFEIKVKALGNTAISLLGGFGMTVCNMSLNIIERRLQAASNQFDSGVRTGSQFVGSLYGQGLAIRNAYENEKKSLKKKQ